MKVTVIAACFVLTTIASIAQGAGSWYLGLEFGPRFNDLYQTPNDDQDDIYTSATSLFVGLFTMVDVADNFRTGIGVQYSQRAFTFRPSSSSFGTLTATFNYIDAPLRFHWYFFGASDDQLLQPHIFIGAVPGFYVGGTLSDGNESEAVVDGMVVPFHFAAQGGAGIDFQITNTILIGMRGSYEYGFTHVDAEKYNWNDEQYYRSVVVSASLTLRL